MLMRIIALLAATLPTGVAAEQIPSRISETDLEFQIVSKVEAPLGSPPLIIALHGYGMDEKQIGTLIPLNLSVPHVYVALRAPLHAPEGGRSWFPIDIDNGAITIAREDVHSAVEALVHVIPTIAEAVSADLENVHLVGFSQGGSLALVSAALSPEQFRSVASFAGVLISNIGSLPQSNLPVLVAHGHLDPVITVTDFQASLYVLTTAGRTTTPFTENVPHVVGNAGRSKLERWLQSHL